MINPLGIGSHSVAVDPSVRAPAHHSNKKSSSPAASSRAAACTLASARAAHPQRALSPPQSRQRLWLGRSPNSSRSSAASFTRRLADSARPRSVLVPAGVGVGVVGCGAYPGVPPPTQPPPRVCAHVHTQARGILFRIQGILSLFRVVLQSTWMEEGHDGWTLTEEVRELLTNTECRCRLTLDAGVD